MFINSAFTPASRPTSVPISLQSALMPGTPASLMMTWSLPSRVPAARAATSINLRTCDSV